MRELAKPHAVRWVRTVDGWERPDSWHVDAVRRPRLHPLVVAAGQGLVSLMALAAFGREESYTASGWLVFVVRRRKRM